MNINNMRNFSMYARVSIFVAACFAVTGCSYLTGDNGIFRGKENDYLRSGTIKPIAVPAGIVSEPIGTPFVIPEVQAKDEFGDAVVLNNYETPRPERLAADETEYAVKIQKLGEDRWIFLNVPTAQVWPQTQSFLSEYNLRPLVSEPTKGIVETDWIAFKDDASTRGRYKIFIEKGVHPDTTEIHVTHVQYPLDSLPSAQSGFVWPNRSMSAEREAWLLDELSVVLAKTVGNSAASLMGQSVGGLPKAQLTRLADEPVIALAISQRRANASVSHAINEDGFIRYDYSQAKGAYHFGYPYYKSQEPGFWDKVAFWRDSENAPKQSEHTLDALLSHLSPSADIQNAFSQTEGAKSGQPLEKASGYLLISYPLNGQVIVKVRDHLGRKLEDEKAKELLRLIRTRLI